MCAAWAAGAGSLGVHATCAFLSTSGSSLWPQVGVLATQFMPLAEAQGLLKGPGSLGVGRVESLTKQAGNPYHSFLF